VANAEQDSVDLRVVEAIASDDFGLLPRSIGAPQPHEDRERSRVFRDQCRFEALERVDLIFGMYELERVEPPGRTRRVTQHGFRGGARIADMASAIDHDETIARITNERL